jgi:excinuclease ABC subunit B
VKKLIFLLYPSCEYSRGRVDLVRFELISNFVPKGDQPEAIRQLLENFANKKRFQTLLGATGTGKTYTMANIIQALNIPTLVMAPNKLLAAQLYQEFKEFFPHNSVHYYISYFDYYQPEAYNPATGVYIEKDSDVNEEIMRFRLASTHALMTRQDVIVVASVSCIYGIGNPIEWAGRTFTLEPGISITRDELLKKLIAIQYERNNLEFKRGSIRVHGDTVDIYPGYLEFYYRVTFFGDVIEKISEMNPITNEHLGDVPNLRVFPTREFVTVESMLDRIINEVNIEMNEEVAAFKAQGKWAEAQRLEERTKYDMEMLRETGYCKGIENYSRYLDQRKPGEPPACLIDYFPKEFLMIMDESHIGVPQISGMIHGDISRKKNLVEYGFRLKAAFDNRPLKFEEWERKISKVMFTTATPGEYELSKCEKNWVDQVIRPTGLVDPMVEVRPVEHQIDNLLAEIRTEISKGNRILITTLTKRMAENISDYYTDLGVKIQYLHSDIGTVERMELIRELRSGKYDAIVGINLLREGLDLPEVGLVAILDADKEGFLRDTRSLIQTIGRASRNANGHVILYADKITRSIESAMRETDRRRNKQLAYNQAHGITPQTIVKPLQDSLAEIEERQAVDPKEFHTVLKRTIEENEREDDLVTALEKAMFEAAKNLEFEKAAYLRDRINEVKAGKVLTPENLPDMPITDLEPEPVSWKEKRNRTPQNYSEITLLGTPIRGSKVRDASGEPKTKPRYRKERKKKFL